MESEKKSLADNIKKFSKVPTLEEKLDIAYNIYLETPKLKDPKPSGFLKIILDKNEKLRENAMKFMKFTLNIDDEAKVLELMERRKKMKNLMIYGIIGLFVMVSMWGIVLVLTNTFDLDTSQSVDIPFFCDQEGTCG